MSSTNEIHDETTIRIRSITVDPLYPVLNDDDECPDFALPLALSLKDSDGREYANPGTIDMTKRQITFNLDFDSGAGIRDFTVEGAVNGLGGDQTLKAEGHYSISNSVTVTFAPLSQKDSLPWGIKGDVTWTFRFAVDQDNTTHTFTRTHPIELYAATPFVGSYKTRPAHFQGMPRKALEFYLIHARKGREGPDYLGLHGYIRSIVEAVHADTGYAYDVWDGGRQFSFSGRDRRNRFDIGAWARHLRPGYRVNMAKAFADGTDSPKTFSHYVNCYDQAGAVWAGIILALQDFGETSKLAWRFAEPYGFIKPTYLVGWYHGQPDVQTDSPYFRADVTKQRDNGETRTGFWNHAFLEFGGVALDATCGPHYGQESLEKYFENSIDYDVARGEGHAPKESNWVNHLNDSNTPQYEIDQANTSGGVTVNYLRENDGAPKKALEAGIPQFTSDQGESDEAKTETYIGEIGMLSFGYNAHIGTDKTLADKIWKKAAIPRPKEAALTWLLDAEKLKSLGTDLAKKMADEAVVEPPVMLVPRLTEDWIHFSWTLISPSKTKRVSVDIFVLPESKEASDLFAIRAFPGAELSDADGSHDVHAPEEGHHDAYATLKGEGHGSRLCVTRNVMYAIQGLRNNDELEPYDEVVNTLFSDSRPSYHDVGVPTIELDQEQEQDGRMNGEVFECKLGGKLALKVAAANGYAFSYDAQHKWVLVPSGSSKIIEAKSATFIFKARNQGTDVLEFSVCGQYLDTKTAKRSGNEVQVLKMQTIKATIRVTAA